VSADVVELFLSHVADRPDHAAVVERGVTVTYGELGERVCRLAAIIARHGPHPKVVIHAAAGMPAYAAMLATLMVGGYYAPLNLGAPLAKQRSIVAQFQPDVVVSAASGADELLAGLAPCAVVDAAPESGAPLLLNPRVAHDLAYVIFTSGSTGAPKGVMVRRAGLTNYISWVLRAMAVTPVDRWSQHPNIGFDLSVLDIYGALCGGATLYPLDANERRFLSGVAIKRYQLTIWNSVPTVLDLMAASQQLTADNLRSLRLMTFCGEPLLPAHIEGIFAARPDLLVHNTYGPTEATVSCTLLGLDRLDHAGAAGASVAIGDPIDNMGVHLVGGETPNEGEIVITGPQLAAGYWNLPDATERQFRSLELASGSQRAYFTGDWAERRDGHIFFRSRMDMQVKVNGYRVELDEINNAIRDCGFAAASLIIDKELHAFVQAPVGTFCPDSLAGMLTDKLEAHFIPQWFHRCDHLPRNANDKIDTSALRASFEAGGYPS
jgi:D-alanine--poly(phosphoribitol) ligase subunit 1